MSTKKTKITLVLIISLLSLGAVIAGLCLFFLTNKVIREVPNQISVQYFDDDFLLTTEFSGKYMYNFKLEQKTADGFVVLNVVKSDKNCISLGDQGLDLACENEFRFSSCFATENDSGNGEYCQPIFWSPTKKLKNVDYASVKVENDEISWEYADQADSFTLKFVDEKGDSLAFSSSEKKFSLKNADGSHKLKAGNYVVYIIAESQNAQIESSNAGVGYGDLEISLKNEILDASGSKTEFLVTCSQRVEAFLVTVDGLKVLIEDIEQPVQNAGNYVYDLSSIFNVFKNLDFSKSSVEIKSLENGLVLESENFALNGD